MNILEKSKQQLSSEILELQRENQALLAQLAFHQKVFKEVHSVLGIVHSTTPNGKGNQALQNLLAENEQLKYQLRIRKLSNREREILQLILDGRTSKEIAYNLNISKLTVDTHRKHIQQKLEVNNNVELIKLALRGGMA